MYIMSYFTESGVPKTGLTAKVSVWRVSDNVKLIDDVNMSEVGGGFYKYNYAGYSPQVEYAIRCDGSSVLSNAERYSFAGNEGFHDDIDYIKTTVDSVEVLVRRVLGLSQENYRLFNVSYDGTGLKMVGCTIKLYSTKADCEADTNAIARYTMSASYDLNSQLSDYKVVKEVT